MRHLAGRRLLATARTWARGLLRGRPCPICAGPARRAGATWRHAYLRCTRCGLIYVAELPGAAEVHAAYATAGSATYQVEHKRDWAAWREHKQRTLDALGLADLERATARKRALDLGCGEGQLLTALRDRGWDARGVELNRSLAEQARALGFRVTTAALEQAEPPDAPFDLLLLFHLLEHLRDPLAALERVRGWLGPRGWLLVETPLRPDYDNTDHLYCFSGAALDLALRRTGLLPRRWHDYVDDCYRHHNLAVLATPA